MDTLRAQQPATMDSCGQLDKDAEETVTVEVKVAVKADDVVAPETCPHDAPPDSESHRSTPPVAPSNNEIAIDDVRQILCAETSMSGFPISVGHIANWPFTDRTGIIQTTTLMRKSPKEPFGRWSRILGC